MRIYKLATVPIQQNVNSYELSRDCEPHDNISLPSTVDAVMEDPWF